jgi:hypothetical protein
MAGTFMPFAFKRGAAAGTDARKYLGFYRMPICSTRGSMKRKEHAEIREGKRRNDEYLHSEMSNSFNNQKNVELETIKTH